MDGVPAHLLSCLMQLEESQLKGQEIHIYGIVNCGFYEGIQAEPALEVLKNWCAKAELIWGAGLGIGGGGALASMAGLDPGKGPKAPIDRKLKALAEVIFHRKKQENQYASFGCTK